MVSQVLAEGQLAVGFQSREHRDLAEKVGHHLGFGLEAFAVFFGPPVAQVPVLVELTALVVETVGHLMADHHADGAVVHGVVGSRVEEGGLQDAGREANLVGRGVIVGVDGLRRHAPFRAVDGFVHLLADDVGQLELRGAAEVGPIGSRVDGQGRVVAPLVGITDLDDEGAELFVRFLLGGVAHPGLRVDALAEGFLQVGHEFDHAFLGRGGEVLLDIHPADGFAQDALDAAHGAFPCGAFLLAAAQRAPVEVEGGVAEGVVERRGGCVEELEGSIGLQVVERAVLPELAGGLDGLGLADADFGELGEAQGAEERVPVGLRVVGEELGVGHLVVVGLRVALLRGAV